MAALIRYGVAMRAFPGEKVCGDTCLVKTFEHGVLIAVADGLGHGEEAHVAGQLAMDTLERHAAEEAPELLKRCHQVLKGSRGAAISLASINDRRDIMTWIGVGNVDALLVHYASDMLDSERLLTRAGVVGFQLPSLRPQSMPIAPGDLLIFVSDGIRGAFAEAWSIVDPLSKHGDVQAIADQILEVFGKSSDDALVMVVRYGGARND